MSTTTCVNMTNNKYTHISVMSTEVQEHLNLMPGSTVVDCTLGLGGHAAQIVEQIGPQGFLIGMDRDEVAIALARERLAGYESQCRFIQKDFRYIDQVLADLGISQVDAILMDLGVSSMQLDDPDRGFSIRENGPLDMRMNQDNFISAYDLVNSLSEKELSFILKKYGEERWHYRIAQALIRERSKRPIETTEELKNIVWHAVPKHNRYQKIHPATRTFQAIRIAVNRELESLEVALTKSVNALSSGGRICVIAFHSLEDRIVKHQFRELAKQQRMEVLTKKPLRPSDEELSHNARSRSARLRAAQKI